MHIMLAISMLALECISFARHALHLYMPFNAQNVQGMHVIFHFLNHDRYYRSYSIKMQLYYFLVAFHNVYLMELRQ